MATLITDRDLERRLQRERATSGADRYDEVWEGVYVVNPMPNDEHQQIVNRLSSIFQDVIDWPGLGDVRPGVNVSDRTEQWEQNYRVPDVAVFLKQGQATNCGAFWHGGPDFAVEIVSPDDQTRQKLPFYIQVRVRELLIVERDPWNLELLRLHHNRFVSAGQCSVDSDEALSSVVLPFTFRLARGDIRPRIEVTHTESGKTWRV